MIQKKYKIIENNIEYNIREWEYDNKTKIKWWYHKRTLHRINGPAVEWSNKFRYYWYLNGIRYPNKKKYYSELLKRNLITKKEAFIELI